MSSAHARANLIPPQKPATGALALETYEAYGTWCIEPLRS